MSSRTATLNWPLRKAFSLELLLSGCHCKKPSAVSVQAYCPRHLPAPGCFMMLLHETW